MTGSASVPGDRKRDGILSPRRGVCRRDDDALTHWWRELRLGVRTTFLFDRLWRAACLEAQARDFERLGLTRTGAELRAKAEAVWRPPHRDQRPLLKEVVVPLKLRPFERLRPSTAPRWGLTP